MNVLKHMEAIFLAATVLAGVSTFANAQDVGPAAAYDSAVSVQGDSKIAVVTISAKR